MLLICLTIHVLAILQSQPTLLLYPENFKLLARDKSSPPLGYNGPQCFIIIVGHTYTQAKMNTYKDNFFEGKYTIFCGIFPEKGRK